MTALLSAFRPGQMGGVAIARLLTGLANPSGKLAQNWVRSAGAAMSGASPWLQYRVGKWVANHRSSVDPDGRVYDPYNDEPGSPLFHFGFGLSYTSFRMDRCECMLTVTRGSYTRARLSSTLASASRTPRSAWTGVNACLRSHVDMDMDMDMAVT